MSYENWESVKECLDKIYAYEWNNIMKYGLVKPCGILIRQCEPDPIFEALSGETGKRLFGGSGDAGGAVGTDAADVIQKALDSLANGDLAVIKAANYPLNKTINVNKPLTLHGVGVGTNLQVTAATTSFNAALNVKASDIELSNFQIEDVAQLGNPTKPLIVYPDASINNILINRVKIKNSSYQGIVTGNLTDILIDNLTIQNSVIEETGGGAGIGIGLGCQNVTVFNNTILEPYHTGIDVWVCNKFIRVLNNYIQKLVHSHGGGIAIAASETPPLLGDTSDIIVGGNKIIGPVEYNGITAWTGSHDYIFEKNIIDGAHTSGIYVGVLAVGTPENINWGKNAIIRGNIIRNVTGSGIRFYFDDDDLLSNDCIISKNRITDVSGHGIEVKSVLRDPVPEPPIDGVGITETVEGNIIRRAGLYGITLIGANGVSVIGNYVINPMQVGPAPYSEGDPILTAILLWGKNNSVIGNHVITDSETVNSIYETAEQGDNTIFGNVVDKPMKLLWSGSKTRLGGNIGFATETSGVAYGTSGMTVAHGLFLTGLLGDVASNVEVLLTPYGSTPFKASYVVDGTNLTIYHDGGGSQYVGWNVKFHIQP
ncbi:right-handed parallel beta-helix repeat-containing protein [Candidatus Bathyarchaeota archaeon]|nr:right-handed parallel beta-helix repeat-containing protein [Candidatus Bathyarchaeota archaeon]